MVFFWLNVLLRIILKNLLRSKILCNVPIQVSPHVSLNTSKGVTKSRHLEGVSEEEMCENLSSQGVVSVRRIKVRRNNELWSLLLTRLQFFNRSKLDTWIYLLYHIFRTPCGASSVTCLDMWKIPAVANWHVHAVVNMILIARHVTRT